MKLELESLKKAIAAYEKLISKTQDGRFMSQLDLVTQKGLQAGVIQNFEFTYELCWKFMKRWLENHVGSSEVDGIPRRELFRLSAESRLIEQVQEWMSYHAARNEIAHTYQEETAAEVYETALRFLPSAKAFLAALEARNA